MSKYKVGDKVKVVRITGVNSEGRRPYIGETFTVESVNPNGSGLKEHYGVEGKCPYIFFVDEVESVEEKKMFTKSDLKNGDVVVLRNGDVEIAIVDLGVFIAKDGFNRINDWDESLKQVKYEDSDWDIVQVFRPTEDWHCQFNSSSHGTLVYDRERDTKKLYNGKVVCIEQGNNPQYKVGKIYQFKDGMMTADNGRNYPTTKKIYSFKDWDEWTSSKFIEVVE